MSLPVLTVFFLALLSAPFTSSAQEEAPQATTEDREAARSSRTDVVVLLNGNRITGEIKRLRRGKLSTVLSTSA